MKIILIILFLSILITSAFADELQVPFSCYPKVLQELFAEKGYKLDLDGSERTPDSWGYLYNKGANYTIFTYETITEQDFIVVREIVFKEQLLQKENAVHQTSKEQKESEE